MSFDLHTHSHYSDGLLSPSQLVQEAYRRGLVGLSLTDHDNLDGQEELMASGRECGIITIPGIEITTNWQGVEVHILGYGVDCANTALRERLQAVIASRVKRGQKILRLLEKVGIKLSWEEVKKHTIGEFVGRLQIYRALKAGGYIGEDLGREAFDYYLGPQGVAYLPHQELDTLEALHLVLKAGGLPVLAHPARIKERKELVIALVENGLSGMEVFYPTHTRQETEDLLRLAEKFGLMVTGGSDFHGIPGEVNVGEAVVAKRYIKRLLKGIRV